MGTLDSSVASARLDGVTDDVLVEVDEVATFFPWQWRKVIPKKN